MSVAGAALPGEAPLSTALTTRTVFHYSLPVFAVGFMWNMVSFYFLKFSTDELLIAPVTVGSLFALARVWDAVSDPLAGYLSDRTRSRWGRRRPWMFASGLPLALVFFGLWHPPAALSGSARTIWVAVMLVGLYTALTAFRIPHASLGAELSQAYHERTRIFAGATLAEALGGLVGIGILGLLLQREVGVAHATTGIAAGVSLLCVVLVGVSVARLREPASHQGRGASRPVDAFRDFARNRRAVRILWINFLQVAGMVCVLTTVPYVAEYLYGDPSAMALFMVAFLVPLLLVLPLWAPLSRRYGKRELWMGARTVQAFAFLALFFSPDIPLWAILAIVAVAGSMEGASGVLSRSICADVIDYDEHCTGDRKEGAYFAAWAMASKLSVAAAVFIVGATLQLSGFEPGVAQAPSSRLALQLLLSAVPFCLIGVAVALTAGLRVSEEDHAGWRRQPATRGSADG